MIQQLHNLFEETTGHILFHLYLELNFSLEEDRSKSETHFKLASALGGGYWIHCIALSLGSLGLKLEVWSAIG